MKKIVCTIIIVVLFLSFLSCSSWSHRWHHQYGINDRRELTEPKSTPKLVEALNDEDPNVRIAAMRCLHKIATPDVIEPIEHVSQTDENESVRLYAQRVVNKLKAISNRNKKYDPVRVLIDNLELLVTMQPKFTFNTGYKDEAIVWKSGLLPINIKLLNLSNAHIRVESSLCKLLSPDGEIIRPLSYEKIIERMKFGYKGGVVSTVLFAPVGIGQLANNKRINDNICAHIEGILLRSRSIAPLQEIEGCLFWDVPRGTPSLDGWRLDLGFRITGGALKFLINDFKGNIFSP